ncbi:MAG: CBS domain-containing protein [Spirochaetia bacterium]|nr:CBS domain-containing protein [Spirochaetia bacterium]
MEIGKLMSTNPITLFPEDPVLEKVQLLDENSIHHIPVVTEGGDLIGIISSYDVEKLTSVMSSISEFSRSILARDIMSKPVFSFYETVSVKEAASAMIENGINAIVVMDENDNISGILTSSDLLRYLAQID